MDKTTLTASDRQAVLHCAAVLVPELPPLTTADLEPLMAVMRPRTLAAGEVLLRVGDGPPQEVLILRGLLRSGVGDAQGREVTLGFHPGPGALPPSIGRTADGRSRVLVEALTPARVVLFDAEALVAQMVAHPAVQRWGDAVLRAELIRRADREWALAALPARERLLALRARLPGLEEQVAHRHIASHLGITPVSLSRLRAQLKAGG
ncbi:Crp/Fnr family transcriptional regulator [Ideonella livida]|uniref:Crp/Fnr family transcriptional regulator n=1 Tax=Ideonella livida TaxID=2707176 RepID=A0A7C9TID6_9BURK|nr:Crp/Fnr family transcriptional regulator [Ideonella livida]NDY90364.1 Crp/Fnr family transcriptional regulator [Ideonella livida]